jgi:hypothetical protein
MEETMEIYTTGTWRLRFCATLLFLTLLSLSAQGESIFALSDPPFQGWLALDGDDDYAETADHYELDVGGVSLTIEAWVNFQSFYRGGIIYKPDSYILFGDYSSGARCIGFILTAPDQLCGFMRCSSPGPAYGWHHVAGVFDQQAGEMRLYLDGEAYGGPYSCPTVHNSNDSLMVGRGWTGEEVLEGAVDEVRISDVVRYPGAFTPPVSPFTCDGHTRALWHFDEFEGVTVFHDVCGADNLLVGYNGAHTEGVSVLSVYLPLVVRSYSQ